VADFLEHPYEPIVNVQWASATLTFEWRMDSDSADISFTLLDNNGGTLGSFTILTGDTTPVVFNVGPLITAMEDAGITAPFLIVMIAGYTGGPNLQPQVDITYSVGDIGGAGVGNVPIPEGAAQVAHLIFYSYNNVTVDLG
jgi:hypothetical protein